MFSKRELVLATGSAVAGGAVGAYVTHAARTGCLRIEFNDNAVMVSLVAVVGVSLVTMIMNA